MPRVTPFEAHHQRHEAWFGTHEAGYIAELLAQRQFVPCLYRQCSVRFPAGAGFGALTM